MNIMATSFKRSHTTTAALSAPNPAAGHCGPTPPLEAPGSVSCGVTAPLSWVLVLTGSVCSLQESASPVLCKFWQLYGGDVGDLLQEGLCHT